MLRDHVNIMTSVVGNKMKWNLVEDLKDSQRFWKKGNLNGGDASNLGKSLSVYIPPFKSLFGYTFVVVKSLLLAWEWKYTVTNVFGYVKTFF